MNKVKEKPADVVVIRKAKAVKIIYWIFQVLTLGTLVVSIITYFIRREGLETTFNQIFMCVITLLTLNAPLLLEKKFKIFIPNYISIVLYFMLFFHFVLGEVYRAYDHVMLFDKILHTTSGVIIAFVSFSIVSILNNIQKNKIKLSPFFIVLFTFCFTMTSEYLWEIFEYLMDGLTNSNMQRWQDGLILADGIEIPKATASGIFALSNPRGSGLVDTMGDMIVNIFGALAVCIYAYVGMKLKPDWFTSKTILTKSDIAALEEKKHVKIDKSYYESVGERQPDESRQLETPPNPAESAYTENIDACVEMSDEFTNETNNEYCGELKPIAASEEVSSGGEKEPQISQDDLQRVSAESGETAESRSIEIKNEESQSSKVENMKSSILKERDIKEPPSNDYNANARKTGRNDVIKEQTPSKRKSAVKKK